MKLVLAVGLSFFFLCSSAKADMNPGQEDGWAGDHMTYQVNVQSFLDYSTARGGLGWTSAQVMREMIAAAEQWNSRGETDFRIYISPNATTLLGYDPNDGANVISICDPDSQNCGSYGTIDKSSCGGLGIASFSGGNVTGADIVLLDRGGAVGCPARWRLLQSVTFGNVSRGIYRVVLHEMGHGLGMAHSSSNHYSIMSGPTPWTSVFQAFSVHHADIEEFKDHDRPARSNAIRHRSSSDTASPLSWGSESVFETTLTGAGAPQAGRWFSPNLFYARVSDGTGIADGGESNGITVYRNSGGSWGPKSVALPSASYRFAHSRPAVTWADGEYMIAWHDHLMKVNISRSNGGPNSWQTFSTGYRTPETPAISYLAATDRTYLLYSNSSFGSSNQRRILYSSTDDNGTSWGSLFLGPSDLVFGGLAFSCQNDSVLYAWPCSLSYVDLNSQEVVWRRVKPHGSVTGALVFDTPQAVGTSNDYSTLAPAITGGATSAGWIGVAAYDRNGDLPSPDYAARVLLADGASFDSRGFAVSSPFNQWISSTVTALTSPALAHFDQWNIVSLFYTVHE